MSYFGLGILLLLLSFLVMLAGSFGVWDSFRFEGALFFLYCGVAVVGWVLAMRGLGDDA